ncbi:hypothetical protein COCCADRAFT_104259, partial [Bipolaris zeicola 26-R-13]
YDCTRAGDLQHSCESSLIHVCVKCSCMNCQRCYSLLYLATCSIQSQRTIAINTSPSGYYV